MKKKKSAKRALLLSAVSLLLCVSMFVGTTYAWFTDSVTSANNRIVAGNLDVELYYQAEGENDWTKVDEQTNIFENILWEPGRTQVVKLKIVNEGSLALKYIMGVNIASENGAVNVAGQEFFLSDYIKYGILDGAQTFDTREQAIAAVEAEGAATLKTSYNSALAELLPKTDNNTAEDVYTDVVTMVVYMPTTVGNEANYRGTAPQINLGINVFATQFTYESDAFNNQYDKDSQMPVVGTGNVPENAQNSTKIPAGKVSVEIPTTASSGFYTVSVTNENETTNTEGKTVFTVDIDLLKDGVKVERNGNVKYLVEINLGADKEIAEVLHKGVAVTDYDYSAQTGILQFETDSFSPFAVIYEVKRVVKVDSVEAFKEALANVTEKTEIDATGVTLAPTDDVTTTIVIPAGVTVKGANFITNRSCWLLIGEGEQPVVFENCTFAAPMLDQFKIATKGCDDITYKNCTFNGFIMINNTDNRDAVNTFENCSFGLAGGFNGYVNCMAATSIFNQCTFNYTGGSTMGSNQYMKWNAVNSYSENTNSLESHNYTTYVELNGCTRTNCATHTNTSNSTLIVR